MSFNLNQVNLAGHLTRDPEVKPLASQKTVAGFALAINRRWKSPDGEQKEEVTFVECEAWGRTAELIGQYLTKGSPVYVSGRLRTDSWEDKDGKKQSRLKVVVDNIQFLPSANGKGRTGDSTQGADIADTQANPNPPVRPIAAVPRTNRASPQAAITAEDEPPF